MPCADTNARVGVSRNGAAVCDATVCDATSRTWGFGIFVLRFLQKQLVPMSKQLSPMDAVKTHSAQGMLFSASWTSRVKVPAVIKAISPLTIAAVEASRAGCDAAKKACTTLLCSQEQLRAMMRI